MRARNARTITSSSVSSKWKDPTKRVVITGMGAVTCFGNDVDTFYNHLLEGNSGVKEITKFDPSAFPTRFAAEISSFDSEGLIDPKNERRLDDSIKYTLVAGNKAIQHARINKSEIDRNRVGVLIGSGMGGIQCFADNVNAFEQKGVRRVSPFFIPYAITNMGSALLAIEHGYMGPNYSISTACATSNYCFTSAADHIRRGDADIMICGGSEAPVVPVGLGGFVACRALSTNNENPRGASRPWDTNRDGFVMGEGSGVLVLESLASARKRGVKIIGEYLGGAFTCDAHHMTDPRKDGLGVGNAIRGALVDAGVEMSDVNYINAHATSTPAGDMAEVNAIRSVFGDMTSNLTMNATKSMIGHSLGAAGGLEAISILKAIETGWLHPTLNHDNPEPSLDMDVCANSKKRMDISVALSNSFGFGGHNSCIAFAPFLD